MACWGAFFRVASGDAVDAGFVSEGHLLQVASVVNALVRGERWVPWEAVSWLGKVGQQEGIDLYRVPITRGDDLHRVHGAEAHGLWRALAARAKKHRIDEVGKQTPPAASTWSLHVDAVRRLSAHKELRYSGPAELVALVDRRMGRSGAMTPPAPVASPASPPPSSRDIREAAPAETTDQRCARLLREFRDEASKKPWGALARVTARDGRARQTVSADIARAKKAEAERSSGLAGMAQTLSRR